MLPSNHLFSSRDFKAGKFPPHGHVEVVESGRIAVAHATGPYNLEGMRALAAMRLQYLQAHPLDNNCAQLTIFHGSAMTSPEALQYHRESLHETFPPGAERFKAIAWVADGAVEGFDWMGPVYASNFASVGIPLRVFHDLHEARDWLQACLRAPGNADGGG